MANVIYLGLTVLLVRDPEQLSAFAAALPD